METTVEKQGKTVAIFNLMLSGSGFENVNVLIEKGKSIRITGRRVYDKFNKTLKVWEEGQVDNIDITFSLGDVAIYGSYNFSYTNPIKSIAEKRIAFAGKSLTVAQFVNYNWNYSAAKVRDEKMNWYD